jgi:uncharacterized protein YbaR (Trm112 family)
MFDERLLEILVCPQDHTPLTLADDELIARLNQEIAAGRIRNRVGDPVAEPITGGLLRQDRTVLYPIIDGIPVLLVEEAIPLEQTGD